LAAKPSREEFLGRAKPGYARNMDNSKEPELGQPTERQKKPVSNAMCLLQYCEALGVEWDSKILPEDTWAIDEPRYVDLHMKVVEALYDKLGLPIPACPYWSLAFPTSALEATLSYKDLIDLGLRAGWIEPR
jgi:hypothetical protein